MGTLSKASETYLKEKFGDRVSFSKTERKLYGHDIAVIPPMVKPIVGDTTPDAVVLIGSEQELQALARWAQGKGIPLTPRGKASSGYGGVLPLKQGIVVDFFRMNKVLDLDAKSLTARVQPGTVWEKLDKALERKGLALRLYPTSYPGSTVGGWFAQGGAGIGSYKYGWFKDNVVSARVVLPDGSVNEFAGEDLDLISDAEGTTGFITELTIRVRPYEDLAVMSIACKKAHCTQHLYEAVVDENLPIWSTMFINPRMANLKNQAPLMLHHGHPAEERVMLPEAYITTVAFAKKDYDKVAPRLAGLARAHDADILPEEIAHHEWEHRFKFMVVKRLGPSLVPAEVVIPLASLGDVMDEIEEKIDQPIVKEGVVVREGRDGKPEVMLLGFIPSDERKFAYNLVFGLVMTVMNVAARHGGRPYSTGFYFTRRADEVLGADRVRRMKAFQKKVDPKGILNPGKVTGIGMMGLALSMASTFEPLIRPFGNYVKTEVGERPTKAIKDIPPEVAWYAYSCSQCGYCVEECDQFYGRGWESQSPRGKWYWLREYMAGREKWNQAMVDTIISCTTCELCNRRCSTSLPIEQSWLALRGKLIHEDKRMTFPPFEMMAEALSTEGDIWAGYRKDRSVWFPEDLKAKHGPGKKSKNVYFAGCTASYVEHDIGIGSVRLLDHAGVDFTYLGEKETCCGTPMLVAGKWTLFEDIVKENIAAVKASGADTVISSCPACDMMWRHVYPEWAEKLGIEYGITAKHYSEVVSEKIKAGEFTFPDKSNGNSKVKVAWHDSCHIGRVSGVYEPPRDLIKAVPNTEFVEMTHHHEEAHCCGSVLTLIKEPEVAADIGKTRLEEATAVGAEKILALCPCCEFQLRVSAEARNVPIEVQDLSHFAAEALGYKLPDPHPEVRAQWAVFEAMIKLMTPQGFAEVMGAMWPELVDAMPMGMGGMMRMMGKVPGALNLMKPMFPILFPMLLPKMMPKVMPVMLERVAERVPMPDYMKEQMPELMPKVMENLMPHMLSDVVPLVTQPMIDYLQGNEKARAA